MTKYVILNEKNEFYDVYFDWAKEYPDAWEFTGIKVARDKAIFVSEYKGIRVKIVADYGLITEQVVGEYCLGEKV